MAYHYIFYNKAEPSNWAGGAAVIVTNIIIAGYVWIAFSEPDDPEEERRGNDNDALHPRTGVFKKRVE